MEFEGLDPGPPRPRPELEPRPLPPLLEPLSSPPNPRGRWSRSLTSSDSEALDSSEFVPGSSIEKWCEERPFFSIWFSKENVCVSSFILTISRVLTVGGPAPSAAAPIGAGGVEWVVAVVCQVAFLPLRARATGSTRRSAVSYPDLTELLVDLETLHAQLLHLLQGRDRVRSVVHSVRFIACSSAHEMFQVQSFYLLHHNLL